MAGAAIGERTEQLLQTILLVDDDPINLDLLKETLDGLGYRLLEAENGQSALNIANRERPDLILLDIMMPGMNGFEVCQQLRSNLETSGIPVIFLSGLDELEDRVRGLQEGAVDFIGKPFRVAEVIARVNTHLTISKLSKEVKRQRDELERELQQVADAQRSLLLKDLPEISSFQLAVRYETSRYAGGDLFDVLPLADNRWGILIADVEGHSTPAAVLMAICCTLMRSYAGDAADPAAVLNYLNRNLCKLSGSRMVTALYAVYDAAHHRLRLTSAGHHSPLLYRPNNGTVRDIECEGIFPLGLEPYEGGVVPVEEIELQLGDQLLFYTDGLVERFNPEKQMYGVERLKQQLAAAVSKSPEDILQQISADVNRFAAGCPADDDQTMLLAIVD